LGLSSGGTYVLFKQLRALVCRPRTMMTPIALRKFSVAYV